MKKRSRRRTSDPSPSLTVPPSSVLHPPSSVLHPPSSILHPPSSLRYYHLTHDYLVPSLREWINSNEQKTMTGRAAIRLAERAAEWTARRSPRYLPAWWEWLAIVLFTRRSRRSAAERRLVRAATWYHAARMAMAAAAVALVSFFIYESVSAALARSAVNALMIAKTRDLPLSIQAPQSPPPPGRPFIKRGDCQGTHDRPAPASPPRLGLSAGRPLARGMVARHAAGRRPRRLPRHP